MEIAGGYVWLAKLADGTEVRQFVEEDGVMKEISVDYLRDKPVREIHMIPFPPDNTTHNYIIIDVGEDEDWLKYWVRSAVGSVAGNSLNLPSIDAIGLFPKKGKSTRRPVRLYIYPDGSMRLTTDKEA